MKGVLGRRNSIDKRLEVGVWDTFEEMEGGQCDEQNEMWWRQQIVGLHRPLWTLWFYSERVGKSIKGKPLGDKLGAFEQRNDLTALPCVLTGSLWFIWNRLQKRRSRSRETAWTSQEPKWEVAVAWSWVLILVLVRHAPILVCFEGRINRICWQIRPEVCKKEQSKMTQGFWPWGTMEGAVWGANTQRKIKILFSAREVWDIHAEMSLRCKIYRCRVRAV